MRYAIFVAGFMQRESPGQMTSDLGYPGSPDGNPYTSVHADGAAQAADLRSFKIEVEWVLR